ncbi:purine-nucleoside phosphorylase [Draconibacterium sediminis]|nr:purine nucleoside permease [Draconibacterium sediminis]
MDMFDYITYKRFVIIFTILSLIHFNTASAQRTSFKVIIITMMEMGDLTDDGIGEAQLWYQRDSLVNEMEIPGAYSPLYYNDNGEGLIITGGGLANATASVMALGLNPKLDLSNTYFIVAGIAGTSPQVCTLGSAVWSEWILDADLCHVIDAKELPDNWDFSRFRLGCKEVWCENGWTIGTEVTQLNSSLVKKAYEITKNVELFDIQEAQEIRNRFPANSAARREPFVTIGDNVAGNTFFYGKVYSEWADWWVKKWTNGQGTYYVTNMEDSGIVTALKRLSETNLISFDRVMALRTASDFDQQYPGENASDCINDTWVGFPIAVENAYRVGGFVAHEIVNNWAEWNEE